MSIFQNTEHSSARLVRSGFLPLYNVNFYQTNWMLTEKCNLRCSYCVNKHKRLHGTSLGREIMLRTLSFLRGANKKKYIFALEGGEVMLYEHLEEMLQYIVNNFHTDTYQIRLISNGTAPLKNIKSILEICNSKDIMFIITLHFEEISVDDVITKISAFDRHRMNALFLVKVLISPGNLTHGLKAVKKLKAIGFSNYRILSVLDFESGELDKRYTQNEINAVADMRAKEDKKELRFFNEYLLPEGDLAVKDFTYTQGIQQGLLRYTGLHCAAGTCSIKINPDGSFARTGFCGEMPYTLAERNPFQDPEFTTPLLCTKPHCTCTAWLKLQKWKRPEDAPVFLRQGTAQIHHR